MRVRIGLPLPNDSDPIEACKKSIFNLIDAFPQHEFEVVEVHGCMIANNRNEIINYAGKEYDKLLFVDSDISFIPWDFERLLNTELRVIAGTYMLRSGEISGWDYDTEFWKHHPDSKLKIAQVECTGLGFCLIDRPVLELMKQSSKVKAYCWYPYCDYLETYLTEDVGFSYNCKTIGVPIQLHQGVQVLHHMRDQGVEYVD